MLLSYNKSAFTTSFSVVKRLQKISLGIGNIGTKLKGRFYILIYLIETQIMLVSQDKY